MSHPAELVSRILLLLQRDYPEGQYSFVTEKSIPGTRLFPDIQVHDLAGALCCVVEIGYTRPEKLSAYRNDLKVPDVRWYDKQGNLHGDVQEKIVKVSVDVEPVGQFVGYVLYDDFPCYSDICYEVALAEAGVASENISDSIDHEFDPNVWNAICEYQPIATQLVVVSDLVRVWLHFYCDKCGTDEWISKEAICEFELLADDLSRLPGREFAREYGPRRFSGCWAGARVFAETYSGQEIVFADGEYLTEKEERECQRFTQTLRTQAMLMRADQ